MTTDRVARREAYALLGLLLLWLLALACPRPLALPDEGRYVGVAWEMIRSGHWLTPTLDGMPYFHKPPLFYWITAGSLSTFGVTVWAARVAPMIGLAIALVSTAAFTARWSGARAARITVLVLLAHPLFFLGGQYANLDMLVAGMITATIVLLAHSALCAERGRPFARTLMLAYVTAALGVLSKGLIGFVIPAMVIGIWLLAAGRWRLLLSMISIPGILLFLLVGAPWFVAMQLRYPGFYDYFFVYQHFRRFAEGGFNNAQPLWFYPVLLVLLTLPWLPWVRRLFARGHFGRDDRLSLRWLMLVWFGAVLLFFSLPSSKLVGYIFPAVPPLVWLIVDAYLSPPEPGPTARRLWAGANAFAGVAGLVLIAWLSVHPPHTNRALAAVLAERRVAGEPVYMVEAYDFDVPVYARLAGPVRVVDDWGNPEIRKRDNWRKELSDAERFAGSKAGSPLVRTADLAGSLCSAPVSWLIVGTGAEAKFPALAPAKLVFRGPVRSLWRFESAAANCDQARRNAQ